MAMMEHVKTINSVLRTLIALAVVGAVGVGGYFGYSTFHDDDNERREAEEKLIEYESQLEEQKKTIDNQVATLKDKEDTIARQRGVIADKEDEIAKLNIDIEKKEEEIARLDTAMRLLKVDHRLAEIKVRDVREKDGQTYLDVEFQEINDEGQPIDEAKRFTLEGDEIRIDTWLVQFEDKYVEQADLDRATSIVLFKRIYGNVEGPMGGHDIENIGTRPNAYARGKPLSEFEKHIWDDFWNIANEPDKAKELGIRAAAGKSDFVKARKGKTYRVELRASGGTTLKPLDDDAPSPAS